MKIRVTIENLKKQISLAAITVDPKSKGFARSKVYLRATKTDEHSRIYLYSNNSSVRSFHKLEGQVDEPGEILLEPSKLLGGMEGRDISLEAIIETVEDADKRSGKVVVRVGRNRFQLPLYIDVKEPQTEVNLLPLKAERVSKIETRDMIDCIRRSSFCIAAGNVNQQYAMDVMMMNIGKTGFTASAFDGYSIAKIFIPRPETSELGNLLIPQDTLGALQKLMTGKDVVADIIYGDKLPNGAYREVFFRTEDSMIGVRLGQGAFPDITKQLNSHKPEFCVAVTREDLKNAVRRAANFVSDDVQKRYIDLSIEGLALTLEAKDGVASDIDDKMDVTSTAGTVEKTRITVSIDYLSNILSGLHEETFQIGFNTDPRKALTVLDGNDTQTQSQYALMPVINSAGG